MTESSNPDPDQGSQDADSGLEQQLRRLEADLADREAALPAHSMRPHQLLEIEELEERIADLRRRLGSRREKA